MDIRDLRRRRRDAISRARAAVARAEALRVAALEARERRSGRWPETTPDEAERPPPDGRRA
jgi:hypothetical protein